MSRNDSSYWHENKEEEKRPVNKTISAQLKHNNQYLLCNRAHVLDISTVWKFPCNNSLHISANSTWKKEEEVNKLLNWVNKIAGDCCGMIWFFLCFLIKWLVEAFIFNCIIHAFCLKHTKRTWLIRAGLSWWWRWADKIQSPWQVGSFRSCRHWLIRKLNFSVSNISVQ